MVGRGGPRRSRRQARDASEDVAQDSLSRRGCRQVNPDLGFISTTRAAILIRRSRKVSNCATRQLERFGIALRNPHRSQ